MITADLTNRLVIIGLLVIALGAEIILYLLYRQGKREVGEVILVVTNIASGLIGYLSSQAKHAGASGTKEDPVHTEVGNKPNDPVPTVEADKEKK